MEANELSMLNKKNKLHLTQTLSTKNKLCYEFESQTLYNKNKMIILKNRSKGGLEDIFMVSVDYR